MKTIVIALAIALVGGLVFAAGASAYDRPPITLYGLYADGWGMNTGNAQTNLMRRYHGIRTIWCEGVNMYGDVQDSSWVDGYSRLWDKLACGGYTATGKEFALLYDQKGKYAWTIYRLKGVTNYSLVYG